MVPWLPDRLPDSPRILWTKRLTARGLGGVAATEKYVLVVDRDAADSLDIFRCLNAQTGDELWTLRYPATGDLDYGNSPRATPQIHDDCVYLLGAFGHLHCVTLATGKVRWKRELRDEFEAEDKQVWGVCSSPLVVDGKLIVNPGAPSASLAALDPQRGDTLWKSPGEVAAFGSFIAAELGGKRQIVGYDKTTLGGWDIATGKRLWTLKPEQPNDFNVPTPIASQGKLIVSTENNGTRAFRFDALGKPVPRPIAVNLDLAPDTHTPVVVGSRLFGVWNTLYCLDVANGLKAVWQQQGDAFSGYASLIASESRVLVTSIKGELILVDAQAATYKEISRFSVFDGDEGVMAHPALVNKRLYVRGSESVACVELG